MSIEVIQKINNILDIADRHSFFQLQYFVIGKEQTLQGMMWQCVRELKSRKVTLENIDDQINEINDDIELIQINIEELNNKEENKNKINIIKRKKIRQKDRLLKNLNELHKRKIYVTEEADFFLKSLEKLQEKEELKPLDDIQSQFEYWNAKLQQELNLRSLLSLPADMELTKTILSLPNESSVKKGLINLLNQIKSINIKENKKLTELIGENG